MPTEAELDWMTAVSSAPAATPSSGLLNMRNICRNSGTAASPDTAPDIVSMPNISVAKPKKISPLSFFFPRPIMYSSSPINASTGVNDEGLSSCTHTLLPSTPAKLSSHAVTVVPMFAPMITWMD